VLVTPPIATAVGDPKIGDVTEQLRVPLRRSGTELARRSRLPAIIISASCASALGIGAYVVFGGSDVAVESAVSAPKLEPVRAPDPAPTQPLVAPPAQAEPAAEPVAEPEPEKAEPAPKKEAKPHRVVHPIVKPKPVAKVVKADPAKPPAKAEKPEPPAEPEKDKEKGWNADSPFMPVHK
jgi:outer membrane biosynthesis protein TonB